MCTRFRNHRSTVGVADKNRRRVLGRKSALGNRDIILQRYRRILNDADIVTVVLQNPVYALPARTIHKTTVNQDNVLHTSSSHCLESYNNYKPFQLFFLFTKISSQTLPFLKTPLSFSTTKE